MAVASFCVFYCGVGRLWLYSILAIEIPKQLANGQKEVATANVLATVVCYSCVCVVTAIFTNLKLTLSGY